MYSHEIKQLLEFKNYLLCASEYIYAFDTKISTQITWIKYNPDHNNFFVRTNDNYEFNFNVVPDKVYFKNK